MKFEYAQSGSEKKTLLIQAFNELGKQKMEVINKMRAVANVTTTGSPGRRPGVVQGGFLNAKKKADQTALEKAQEAGAEFAAKWLPLAMRVKNFALFVGVVGLMHWQGDQLHIPVPVL